jgi:mRNA-degrading endonuclease RelE of RelBE toxin-antitoxin system
MKTTADKDIEKLNPKFREKVKLFINEVNKNEKLIFIIE